ncbi:MAG TPA: CHAP domain-containing protein [Bacteroidia bacterium]
MPTASATPFAPDLSNAGYKNPTNTYPYGQCTWFAWGRAYEHGVTMPHYGNAVNWYNNNDYPKSSTPRSDSIAVWSGGSPAYGHVAYVERVDGDLYILMKQIIIHIKRVIQVEAMMEYIKH